MPRAYGPDEQERIRAALLAAGRARFADHGLARVTVSELTEAAGIGKGSFYLFYTSKEALFFAIQEQEEATARARIAGVVATLEGVEAVEAFFRMQFAVLEEHPFLRRLAEPQTIAALRRKLPPALLDAHIARDTRFTRGVVAGWIARGIVPPETDPDLVHALSASAFALALSRGIVGEQFGAVTETIARALARDLVTAPATARGAS